MKSEPFNQVAFYLQFKSEALLVYNDTWLNDTHCQYIASVTNPERYFIELHHKVTSSFIQLLWHIDCLNFLLWPWRGNIFEDVKEGVDVLHYPILLLDQRMNLRQVYYYWDVVALQNLGRFIVHISKFNAVDDTCFKYFERYFTELYLVFLFLLVFTTHNVSNAKGKLRRRALFIICAIEVNKFDLKESYLYVELWKPLLALSN